MNNPNMYTNKQKSGGMIKYAIVWIAVLGIIIFLLARAFTAGSRYAFTWNVDQFEYALNMDHKTKPSYEVDEYGNAITNFDDDMEASNFDIYNVSKIELNLSYVVSNAVVTYTFADGNNRIQTATATVSWVSLSGDSTSRIESAVMVFENTMNSIEASVRPEFEVIKTDRANQVSVWTYVLQFLPFIVMLIVGIFVVRSIMKSQSGNQSTFDFGKSKARLEDASKIRFEDVAGCEDEKEEMKEIVDYLKNPKKYSKSGARIPKGVILKGNPGTGKTLLARAVAGEASVPFYYISGSDFLEMFVGVGASRVRDMFKKARMTAPCIVFIDEIDAIGRQRGTGLGGGHDEREQTLNQLLVEMDGFEGNSGVIVLAATNRIDVLDPALLRPGRFDRQIEVALPDLAGRVAILKVHSRNKVLASNVSLESVAKRTPGFSGAELENVLNEAAILSVREKHEKISASDIDEAIDRVMAGPAKKSKIISERAKKMVAYHEAGHAVVGLKVADAETVQKITIIPRGDAGGYVLMTPKDETMLQTKGELKAKITSYLAGRASEEIFFEDVTTGAVSDIERATRIARAMVTELGMSKLGPIKYESDDHQVFLGRDYGNAKISGDVANEIDSAVREIIEECLSKAKQTISENKDLLVLIAEALLKYETITAEEIDFLVKYGSLDAYDMYKKNAEELARSVEKENIVEPESLQTTDIAENVINDEEKDEDSSSNN